MLRLKDGEALEDLLKGKMKIIQKKNGYRFSIDAVLLANFTRVKKGDHIADLGTGSGVIPLLLSRRMKGGIIKGIELDCESADMASRSVELNGLSGSINIECGDLRLIKEIAVPEGFDLVVANPPYGKQGSGRINPAKTVAAARHELSGGLEDFVYAASFLLKYGGRFSAVYPSRRLADIFSAMRDRGIEPKRLRLVHSITGEAAKLLLIEGVKGGGSGMEVLPPLYIYREKGVYSEEVEAMYC